MNAPVGLIGIGLLFWGQQNGLWPLAVPMALALEASRFLDRRWDVAREDFYRVGDISTLLFAALVVYFYLTRGMAQSLAGVLAWFPLCAFPLIAAQCFSDSRRLDLGALYWSERRRGPVDESHSVDFSYPYLVVCILSAGWANVRTPVFYAIMSLLGAWALWPARARSRPLWVWAGLVALAGLLGYKASGSLKVLQATLEQAAVDAVSGIDETLFDPDQTRTAIGRIGRIQQSGDIVLRVKPSGSDRPPRLMRAASYDLYVDKQWFSPMAAVHLLAPGATEGVWDLGPSAARAGRLGVTAVWPKGEGLLLLPMNAFRIDGLRGATLSRNAFGALKATQVPSVVHYGVSFGGDADRDGPPVPADRDLPTREAAVFRAMAQELGLSGVRPPQRVKEIERFFADDFHYSIYQGISGPAPLETFLRRSRAGHCEYFATATVLLLRAAGIPARYATGFAVMEYSRFEGAYVVRQRHAHAWALAYIDGAWRDVDTTPASWVEIERTRGSFLEPLSDLADWVGLRFAMGRLGLMGAERHGPLAWLLLFSLVAWIIWKSAGLLKASQRAGGAPDAPAGVASGSDSEFYEIERLLARSGFERQPWEAFAGWVARIAPELRSETVPRLRELVRLHSRYRFDPKGLNVAERQRLKTEARGWLADHARP